MKVVFQEAAVDDLKAIAEYIRHDSPTAARAVVRRVRASTRRLSEFPFLGRSGAEPGTLEVVVTRAPYIVVYRVVGGPVASFVEIIAVFHAHRDRIGGQASNELRKRLL